MKKKSFHKLVENMKSILKDKDQLEEIYRRIDENILLGKEDKSNSIGKYRRLEKKYAFLQ
ncbi:FbpB family small basic protein [Cytobacillus firmus]|uniref:FbpB family small basic protein n=1 Tax=Cytobacillus firmus TaxID=1399 RepID=UPI0018CEF5F2|nr:FbpB family small basic protein [Cytobacillus firmus]MBG9588414.1 hypothetical protein [Cytobacillus firmus]